MLWVPDRGFTQRLSNVTGAPSANPGGSIADPATAHTKSSYTDLTTSLAFDCELLCLSFYGYGGAATGFNELKFAAQVAREFSCRHQELIISARATVELLPRVLWHCWQLRPNSQLRKPVSILLPHAWPAR